MRVNTEEPQLIPKPGDLSERHPTSPADFEAPRPGSPEIALLARQIKQLKQSPKAGQNRRPMARRVIRKVRDAKDGSWTRTVALVAMAFTSVGLFNVIRDPGASPRGMEGSLQAEIDITHPQQVLPSTPINQIDLEFIKRLEGFHSTPYFDGTQKSWGYGTKAGRGSITRTRAEQEMQAYLQKHCLPILPRGLPAHQATALVSFCYNLGPDQAQATDLWQAAHRGGTVNFLGYTRSARGVSLLSRRRKEQALWEGRSL